MWWYRQELSTKVLLDNSKSMKTLKWTALITTILWTILSVNGTNSSVVVLKWRVNLFTTILVLIYLSLIINSFNIKDLQERRQWNRHHQFLIWIWSKIYGKLWRWNCMKVANNIKAKKTYGKQLKLSCLKLNQLK